VCVRGRILKLRGLRVACCVVCRVCGGVVWCPGWPWWRRRERSERRSAAEWQAESQCPCIRLLVPRLLSPLDQPLRRLQLLPVHTCARHTITNTQGLQGNGLLERRSRSIQSDSITAERAVNAMIFLHLIKLVRLTSFRLLLVVALCRKLISELRSVTCRIGSHSVTCHPTQVSRPACAVSESWQLNFTKTSIPHFL